ncbi:MAG TPA: SDR family oxidoreductase [Myxococcota bacterium]|jgi:3-oxoacyl-[acyl-carrier protein] reductase|nr:SDR family oxidoreductase [Myxococcota bacterium]
MSNQPTIVPGRRSGKVALIPGGARGIGRAIALRLGEMGWSVAIAYRQSEQDATVTAAQVRVLGGGALVFRADCSVPEEADGLIGAVETEWGRIDALIHTAGPYHRVELLDETPEGWRKMMANNLDSFFYVARRVAPGMAAQKSGRIIAFGMASADRLSAQTGVTAHYIAKAGVLVLVRSLAKTLAKSGVTVNAISPGFIDSGSAPPEELAKMVKSIPAGYVGTTADAVGVAAFLLSDEARYVNGANIHLSGAWGL